MVSKIQKINFELELTQINATLSHLFKQIKEAMLPPYIHKTHRLNVQSQEEQFFRCCLGSASCYRFYDHQIFVAKTQYNDSQSEFVCLIVVISNVSMEITKIAIILVNISFVFSVALWPFS